MPAFVPVLSRVFVAGAVVLCVCQTALAEVRARANDSGSIHFLSWDNEGGDMAQRNLLRPETAIALQSRSDADQKDKNNLGRIDLKTTSGGGFELKIAGGQTSAGRNLALVVPFDPRTSAVSIVPARIDDAQRFHLPAVLSAPGFGQMLVTAHGLKDVATRFEGSRRHKKLDWSIELPPLGEGQDVTLTFRPLKLAPPSGVTDKARWDLARRAWLNVTQPTARWGEARSADSAPAGVLGNNVLSDPVSSCLFIYADHAFLAPQLTPDINCMDLVGRTLDWWLEERMLPSGEVPGYTRFTDFLDTNPSILISAWDYAEATGDRQWLEKRIATLERVAAFQASRDIDHDGLVEAVQSGNAGTLVATQRSCSAYDALNCGHKDAYSNILTYRAFRCMADLERKLGRADRQQAYDQLADRLQASFLKLLFNREAENVVSWISRDGQVHDYLAPSLTCSAISYGLIDHQQGKRSLKRLRDTLTELGFKRYDLGMPMNLFPIRRLDYMLGKNVPGAPQRDDGTDTFGLYLNGGIATGDALRFITAHYDMREKEYADSILDQMLARIPKGDYAAGGFPIGIVDLYPDGAEFLDWNGKPCGYEGLMTHGYHFVDAVCLREPEIRARLYRPMRRD